MAPDLAGRAVSVTDANGNTTVTDYDKMGRVVKVTAPFDTQNAITKTYYDKNSNVIKKSVRKAADIYNSQEYKYDNMGNLLASITGEGDEQSVVQYTYDSANRKTKMITGLSSYSANPTGGSVTQYTYDNNGFTEEITDPMGNAEEFWEYDKYGNVEMIADRNGNVNGYTYGAYGLKQKSSMAGPQNTTTYNSIGQIVKTTAKNERGEMVEESYAYDPFGRLTSKTANDGTVQNYTYDNNSNVVTYTMTKDGETKNSIEYTYNTLNQLTKFNSDDMIYQYGYDKNGNLSWAYDAKLVNFNYEITYNKANLPKRIETTFDSKNYDYTLSYWLNGQKFLEQDTVNNVWTEYDYNSLGQLELELKQANNKTVCERGYTYDASGNRTQMRSWNTEAGKWDEIIDYTYDANNRLTNEITKTNDEITSAVRYYYDENGNLTSEQSKVYTTEGTESSNMGLSGRIGGGSAKVYTYDRFNRLMQYNDGATEATYTYGADNLRASKTVNGTKTEFVWNGQNLASETTDDVTTIYNYDMTGVLGSKKDGETEIRYHKDPHGNVLATEKNNALTGEYTYDAFGNQLTTAELDNPFRYCGEYFDNESGNIYLRNRYYDTRTGRFINEDPIKDGVNWYSYCGGNPIVLVDPSGLDAIVLTNSKSVGVEGIYTAGHTSALYQNENGSWYYTYWGNKAAAVIYIADEYMDSLESFNQELKNILDYYGFEDITVDYDNATYIMGDFTESLQAAYDDVDDACNNRFSKGASYFDSSNGNYVFQGHNSPYNVGYNNCLDRTYAALSLGTLADGSNAGDYMSELGLNGGLIPNNAASKFAQVFMNSAFNQGDAWWELYGYVALYDMGSSWAQSYTKANYAYNATGCQSVYAF